MAVKFDVNAALDKYLSKNKTDFPDSLRQVLKFINADPNISDVKSASYLLATSKIEADYSLQRWEGDYLCGSRGIPQYPPCQKTLDYYRSTKNGKRNYYELGVDNLGVPFYGRGLIQITGKSNYEKYGKVIGIDLNNNPELALVPENSYRIASSYFKERVFKHIAKDDLTAARKSVNGGTNRISDVNYYYNIWVDILESIESVSGKGDNSGSQVPNQSQSSESTPPPISQGREPLEGFEGQDSSRKSTTNAPIVSLTQIIKPQISPTEINIDASGISEVDKKQFSKGLANVPFIWYNGYQISYNDIRTFSLYHKDMLPMMRMTFLDTLGIMKQDGFPLDNSIITVYISSRSKLLRSIKMDFKILNFKDCGEGIYSVDGICNVPSLYLYRFKSYSKKTSYETLLELAKESGLGFCSNIQNTNDKMTWINPGIPNHEFIKNVINNSYLSDNSFLYCYIDYYYNLCYVDISKELDRDVSSDRMITSFGYSSTEMVNEDIDDRDTPLILCNDKSFIGSSSYFDTYEILNKSTRVSLQKAYSNRSKTYDSNQKELLVFDIDSITSDGSGSIIMKALPGDEKFFNDNITSIWLGKQDMFSDDGSGNVHKNYNYSVVQNRQNLDDITKVASKLTLTSPNYNLYKYQKISLLFSAQKQSISYQEQFYKRLSGDWLITNIDYIFGGKISQIITLIKRELSLSDEEKNTDPPPKKEVGESNTNEFSPNVVENENVPPDSSIPSDPTPEEKLEIAKSDLFKRVGNELFVVDSKYGVGGKFLEKFGSDLQKHLMENYPDGGISISNNGIVRDLYKIVGTTNPNSSSTSKHGAGLAQDYKINTGSIIYAGVSSNSKLVKDVKLMTLIDGYVKNGPYKNEIRWGGNFTGMSQAYVVGLGNICVNELHHFEIVDKEMAKYFTIYENELSTLGLSLPQNKSDLSEIYARGVSNNA